MQIKVYYSEVTRGHNPSGVQYQGFQDDAKSIPEIPVKKGHKFRNPDTLEKRFSACVSKAGCGDANIVLVVTTPDRRLVL